MKQTLYVGRYSTKQGISVYLFDSETGMLTHQGDSAFVPNSSYLCKSEKNLYAVLETNTWNGLHGGAAAAFSLDGAIPQLLNIQPTGGSDPCHLTCSPDGCCFLFCANYSEGSFTGFPIKKDGSLAPSCLHKMHSGHVPNSQRQEQAHVHFTAFTPDGHLLCVVDLGTDTLTAYKITVEDNHLTCEPHFVQPFPGGFGPRHLVFSPDGRFAYVIGELSCSVAMLSYDTENGFGWLGEISALPQDCRLIPEFTGAALKRSADGRFYYASNRGHNSIAVMEADLATGELTQIQSISLMGDHPREISLDLSECWLFAADKNDNRLSLFHRDAKTGQLIYSHAIDSIEEPTCLLFAENG